MANVLAPFGFRLVAWADGGMPNFATEARLVAKANATAIYSGDPVTQLSTGYVTQSTAGTTPILGVFQSCSFFSTSLGGQTRRLKYWPGSDATGDVAAVLITSPNAIFMAQANAQATLSHVGQNANFALGTGSTITGYSGASLDISTVNTTSTLPFTIIGLAGYNVNVPYIPQLPPGSNGADNTSANNYVYVRFNNQMYKQLTGI